MINPFCRHFRGEKPCAFNKHEGSECRECAHVSEFNSRILIIKLDALGDVLRTGSLVPSIVSRHGTPWIAWLTRPDAVELVRMIQGIDEIIPLSVEGLARISTGGWDYVYSLSNDRTSASLAALSSPVQPVIGFSLRGGILHASNEAATRWLEMASFDRLKLQNQLSYQRLMMDIIGDAGPVVPPGLVLDPQRTEHARSRVADLFPGSTRRRVTVNLGSGQRWPKKMIGVEGIAAYARRAVSELGVDVLLVGGPDDEAKALAVGALCDDELRVRHALTVSIPEFIAVLQQVDTLLCGDTLAVHAASALGLPAVCVFGPTSLAEIPDFEGLILKTAVEGLECLGCYGDCTRQDNCMSMLDIGRLIDLTRRQLLRSVR